MSSVYADFQGPGSVIAAQMAVEDFNKQSKRKVEVISGDHQNKPDIGAGIARRWLDVEGVDVILDLPNSAVALAVGDIVREKNKVAIGSGAGTALLTGAKCSPNFVHWTYDTWAMGHGPARILVNCAGVGTAKRIVGREGPMPLADYERVIRINLIGTFNMMRLVAAAMQAVEPLPDGERGVIVSTASVAAFEGQIGQAAYASSKGGVAALTLPAAREFSQFGIRVLAIAPGIFGTPMLKALPQEVQDSLGASVPFPKRLGEPREFAALVLHCVHNGYLNGEVIRLDGALRMAPR